MTKLSFRTEDGAKAAAALIVFAAPLSRALFNFSLLLLVVFSLCSPAIRRRFRAALSHTLSKAVLALFGLIALGSLYSPAPHEFIARQLKTYSLFALVPLFMAVLHEKVWQTRTMLAFVGSMGLIVALTYLDVWINIPGSSSDALGLGVDHSIFSDYVVQSIISAFFVALCFYQVRLTGQRSHWARWLLAAAVAAGSITFLLASRTGFILLVLVSAVIVLQTLKGKHVFIAGGTLLALGVALIASSPLALSRLTLAIFELQNITNVDAQSSFSLRLATWVAGWDMFVQQPFIGRGTGSYAYLAASYFKDCTWLCVHPHNQYLFFMIENGLVGLLFYCGVLIALLRMAFIVEPPLRHLVYSFFAILVVNSFFNAPFWFNREAYFFYTMMALLAAMMMTSSADRDSV
jgi:O-antigen ligase